MSAKLILEVQRLAKVNRTETPSLSIGPHEPSVELGQLRERVEHLSRSLSLERHKVADLERQIQIRDESLRKAYEDIAHFGSSNGSTSTPSPTSILDQLVVGSPAWMKAWQEFTGDWSKISTWISRQGIARHDQVLPPPSGRPFRSVQEAAHRCATHIKRTSEDLCLLGTGLAILPWLNILADDANHSFPSPPTNMLSFFAGRLARDRNDTSSARSFRVVSRTLVEIPDLQEGVDVLNALDLLTIQDTLKDIWATEMIDTDGEVAKGLLGHLIVGNKVETYVILPDESELFHSGLQTILADSRYSAPFPDMQKNIEDWQFVGKGLTVDASPDCIDPALSLLIGYTVQASLNEEGDPLDLPTRYSSLTPLSTDTPTNQRISTDMLNAFIASAWELVLSEGELLYRVLEAVSRSRTATGL